MAFFNRIASFFLIAFTVLSFHPIYSIRLNIVITLISLALYAVCSRIAEDKERKLKERIKALEDKTK